MSGHFPARIHALLASAAPVGVVLRRGPSNAVCSIGWDRQKDEFQLGQWVRARIYERRCDISPDGRHMIYFARTAKWASETRGTYTAISRVPWLKAVTLYGKGDCWQGGGLFTSNTKYWVNGRCCHFTVRESLDLACDNGYTPAPGNYGGECPGLYYRRLQRDGWALVTKLDSTLFNQCTLFEKTLPHGWVLRKFAWAQTGAPPGKGCYWDEHELENAALGRRYAFPKWEWAEQDGATLVWAEAGCLFRAPLRPDEPGETRKLADFNGMGFERRIAPY